VSLLVATQISAVATAILAAGAIVTALFAYLAFRKQSTEVNDRQAAVFRPANFLLRTIAAQPCLKAVRAGFSSVATPRQS
jgi:uncharacterized membrane protein